MERVQKTRPKRRLETLAAQGPLSAKAAFSNQMIAEQSTHKIRLDIK
jgi:hypothetical protein